MFLSSDVLSEKVFLFQNRSRSRWSYGVVLWEIFTLGGSPYPGVATDEFLSYLKSKKRMEQPESCPDEFYQLMLDCWEDNPEMRPTFSKIYQGIGDIIETFADAVCS